MRPPIRRWKDLTSDQKKQRQAWTRGGAVNETGDRAIPVDPEVQRIAGSIRQRVRAQRVAEGRV